MPLRTYDADGEMTDDDGTTLAWTAFGKAATVTQAGGNHLTFTYGPDDARIEKDATVGNQSEQVLYFSGAERLAQGPYNQIRRTVTLADLSVIDTGGAGGHVLYPVTDNLGSTIALGNADGSLAQGMDYGPFGNRTSAGWTGPLGQNQAININTTETDRGYTGQEELDTVDLVDYNARLYDPALGRFLSVDPLMAYPESTQGINPYSYVENNPLNATDPTGEMPEPSLCNRNNTCAAMTASALEGTMATTGVATHLTGSANPNNSAPTLIQAQGTTAENSSNGDSSKVSDHDIKNKKKDSTGGIGPIKGYPEKGKDSWRASNDKLFEKAAKAFDKTHNLKPGDNLYMTPKMIKAWAMVESGGSKKAFTTDPLQVNASPQDFRYPKGKVTGLRENQKMTPETSVNAALKWLWHKATIHNAKNEVIGYRSLHKAFYNYNGKLAHFPNPNETHAEWYANKVISLGGG